MKIIRIEWFSNRVSKEQIEMYNACNTYDPTCAGLPFERLSFDISKNGSAQFGPIIQLEDAIADNTLSSKQVVPLPSK